MNVFLSPALEKWVQQQVETGRYGSANEVIREALRLLDDRDRMQDLQNDDIAGKIAVGMASLRAGRSTDGEAFFDRIEAELDADERPGAA